MITLTGMLVIAASARRLPLFLGSLFLLRETTVRSILRVVGCALALYMGCSAAFAAPPRHYVFFGQDREMIAGAASFFDTKALEGAQVVYTWAQLEPQKDHYDFSAIRQDLALLHSRGKKLFVQFRDVTFSANHINLPRYLLTDPQYHGGAEKQYEFENDDKTRPMVAGWSLRRWDPQVQKRLYKLFNALGKEFDGRIEGIALSESAVGIEDSEPLRPQGFSNEIYRDAIIANMKALRRAFPRSVVIQYANFMPGEWRPTDDKGYLRAVYHAAQKLGVGVGGPDLLPYRPGQLGNSYPLIREAADTVPIGVAVQDGNYADKNPKDGKRITVPALLKFATEYLKVNYLFWCMEEPYYTQEVVPFLREMK